MKSIASIFKICCFNTFIFTLLFFLSTYLLAEQSPKTERDIAMRLFGTYSSIIQPAYYCAQEGYSTSSQVLRNKYNQWNERHNPIADQIKASLKRTGNVSKAEQKLIDGMILEHIKENIENVSNKREACDNLINNMGSGELDLKNIYPKLVKKLETYN